MSNDNWIMVRDQLPSEGQKVIYYFYYTGVWRGTYKTVVNVMGEWNCFSGEGGGFLCGDVTHSMPDEGQELPEAPKYENGITW